MKLKFRAWDEIAKIMHYDFEFIRSGESGGDWIIFKSDKQTFESGKVWENPYPVQRFKIMQFTGFYDKYGDAIYEGDLVKLGDGDIVLEIIFKDGAFRDNFWGHTLDYLARNRDLTIVGNIYKN